jgi:hypothetical protein
MCGVLIELKFLNYFSLLICRSVRNLKKKKWAAQTNQIIWCELGI